MTFCQARTHYHRKIMKTKRLVIQTRNSKTSSVEKKKETEEKKSKGFLGNLFSSFGSGKDKD